MVCPDLPLGNIWDKELKTGPRKIYGKQPLEGLKEYGLLYGIETSPLSYSANQCNDFCMMKQTISHQFF